MSRPANQLPTPPVAGRRPAADAARVGRAGCGRHRRRDRRRVGDLVAGRGRPGGGRGAAGRHQLRQRLQRRCPGHRQGPGRAAAPGGLGAGVTGRGTAGGVAGLRGGRHRGTGPGRGGRLVADPGRGGVHRGRMALHRRAPTVRVRGTGRVVRVRVLRTGGHGRHRLRADRAASPVWPWSRVPRSACWRWRCWWSTICATYPATPPAASGRSRSGSGRRLPGGSTRRWCWPRSSSPGCWPCRGSGRCWPWRPCRWPSHRCGGCWRARKAGRLIVVLGETGTAAAGVRGPARRRDRDLSDPPRKGSTISRNAAGCSRWQACPAPGSPPGWRWFRCSPPAAAREPDRRRRGRRRRPAPASRADAARDHSGSWVPVPGQAEAGCQTGAGPAQAALHRRRGPGEGREQGSIEPPSHEGWLPPPLRPGPPGPRPIAAGRLAPPGRRYRRWR